MNSAKIIYEKVKDCCEQLRARTDFRPEIALILGSGLGGYASQIDVECTVPYGEIDGFPISTVPGHNGRFIFGRVAGVPVVCMQGRVHYYEGYSISDVVLPVRVMCMLGAKVLFLTNAAGGINPDFNAGDLMLIRDQIASFMPSPLIGENIEEFGLRFPDMSSIYRPVLCDIIRAGAKELGIDLKEGVYCQLTGPNFETPAEVRMCGILGADAVGMSTAVEAVAANHMGMKVCGVSCISNKAAGLSDRKLTHEEVQEAADKASVRFEALVTESIKRIGADI